MWGSNCEENVNIIVLQCRPRPIVFSVQICIDICIYGEDNSIWYLTHNINFIEEYFKTTLFNHVNLQQGTLKYKV